MKFGETGLVCIYHLGVSQEKIVIISRIQYSVKLKDLVVFSLAWNGLKDITEVCFLGSNQQYPSIGSDNGLVPTRRQAIIWTNSG